MNWMENLDPSKTAKSLNEHLGKERAIAHCDYVLSPEYALMKKELRKFWEDVKTLLIGMKDIKQKELIHEN